MKRRQQELAERVDALAAALDAERAALAGWPVRGEVIVHLKSRTSIRGVLWEASPDVLILKNAWLLEDEAKKTQLDGETLIERADVDFVQIVRR